MQGIESLPEPEDGSIRLRRLDGGDFAAVSFGGVADEARVRDEVSQLRRRMEEAGLRPARAAGDGDYVLARYNDPGTAAIFRRNDVLIELSDFQLW